MMTFSFQGAIPVFWNMMLLKLAVDHVSETGWKDRKFLRGHERERRPSPLDLVCFTCLLRVKKHQDN